MNDVVFIFLLMASVLLMGGLLACNIYLISREKRYYRSQEPERFTNDEYFKRYFNGEEFLKMFDEETAGFEKDANGEIVIHDKFGDDEFPEF